MDYLLSNGIITTDQDLYLKDMLALNLGTLPQDIPFNEDIGLDTLILSTERGFFLSIVRDRISNLLTSLSQRHGADFSLESVDLELSTLKISISINNSDSTTYDIQTN